MEVSPGEEQKADCFLHALTVMDAGVQAGPEVERIGDEKVVGILALDRVVVFGLEKAPQTEVVFRLEADARAKILVCDLAPGFWRIALDGNEVQGRTSVTGEAGSLYFEGGPGRYALSRVDDAVPPEPAEPFWERLAGESMKKGDHT